MALSVICSVAAGYRLSGAKPTFGQSAQNDANDPGRTWGYTFSETIAAFERADSLMDQAGQRPHGEDVQCAATIAFHLGQIVDVKGEGAWKCARIAANS